ncbi:MAG: glycosyltransferase family 4 protein [Melioribacteraceae bacterium]|nr:glycosyltransferase family 4 protein [Melioribacteraceae bacterium]
MKILQISPKIPYPPEDGHKKSIFTVLKYLSLRGHQIDLLAYSHDVSDPAIINEVEKYCRLISVESSTKNSVSGALTNLFQKMPYNFSKFRTKELEEKLIALLKDNEYDIVHVINAHLAWVIEIVKIYSKAKTVLREENLELNIMKRFYEKQSNPWIKFYSYIQYKKMKKYEPEICVKFDACVMISEIDKEHLEELNPRAKVFSIPIGIEEELFNLQKNEVVTNSLVAIGSLDWYPNLDGINWFINSVLPMIVEKNREAKLFIYGGGDSKKLLIPNSVKDNIIIEGFVDDIWSSVLSKSLAIVPIRIGSGIRVKILEMLAAGENIITTSIGAEGIPVKKDFHLLIEDKPIKFAETILRYFKGEFNSEQLRINGREFIKENYTAEKTAEKFETIYISLLNKN